jgi:ketosteroid isomerase-like protein
MAAPSLRREMLMAMAEDQVEIVRTALTALDRRDLELYLSIASPEIELFTPASPLEGPSVGHEGIRRFFEETEAHTESSSVEVEEIRDLGPQVLAFFTVTAVGRLSGAETSLDVAGLYSVQDGKLRRAQIYADRREALQAAGLSE